MTITPMEIRRRPFSIEFYTNIMMPDGIFDTAIKRQWITCFYTNISAETLYEVSIYLEGIEDPGIMSVAQSYLFPEIKPEASVRVSWLADFEHGKPGKKIVSFIAQAKGMSPVRTLKHIFVSETKQDETTGEYVCNIGESALKVSKLEVIGPKENRLPCSCSENEGNGKCQPAGPWVPVKISMASYSNTPYPGIHNELPFSDPWWKVVAWVVAAVAAIVAVVAAAKGEGTAGTAVKGGFDETGGISCCTPDPGGIPGDDSLTVAGVASAIATAAVAVGMSDYEDPFWRGQEATFPTEGELTVAEKLEIQFNYPVGAPQAGVNYPVNVKWEYQRITTGKTYTHFVEEVQVNTHLTSDVYVEVPSIHEAFKESLIIKARFKRTNDELYTGEDLYAFSLLRSPNDMYFFINLSDDGIEYDEQANDGTYTGSIHLEKVYGLHPNIVLEGDWRIYVFAQDVNDAAPDMPPQVAATRIGGNMIASGLQITFDPSLPCPLEAQATVKVVH